MQLPSERERKIFCNKVRDDGYVDFCDNLYVSFGGVMAKIVQCHNDLEVYNKAFAAAMSIFDLSKSFPHEEKFALTDQIRRSSRAVCANIAEAWRNRRYQKMFVSKLSIAESESAETQVWLEFAVKCGYLNRHVSAPLYREYDAIITSLVGMIRHSHKWTRPDKA